MKRQSVTAAGFLERATELRAIASQIKDSHNRDLLVGAAEQYERMADKLMAKIEPADASK